MKQKGILEFPIRAKEDNLQKQTHRRGFNKRKEEIITGTQIKAGEFVKEREN